MKIYTKTGDDGSTSLWGGERVSKTSSYIEAYGSVDELNASIGFAAAFCAQKETDLKGELTRIQHDLHTLCADLAAPLSSDATKSPADRIKSSQSLRLESVIDSFEKELSPLKQFILAGGSELASRLHLARTICRRAERAVIAHGALHKVNAEIMIYLNRLSDLLFVLARLANKRAGISDVVWKKDTSV